MSKLEAIEAEVRNLPLEQAAQLQDWLADYLEDAAELNPEFVASIERGNADLREGRVRVHRPDGEKECNFLQAAFRHQGKDRS